MNGWPAIVSVPVRAGPVFGATVKPAIPLPVPDDPDVIVTHVTFDTAVHVQVVPAVTETVLPPP